MDAAVGGLERDRAARAQRVRRQFLRRVDYVPSKAALAVFEARQAAETPGTHEATNSAVIDSILVEWAALTGIKYREIEPPTTLARAEVTARLMSLGLWTAPRLRRVPCGARRHRDGEPCRALSEPGKKRCRFHGGRSTGPRTPEGKARCAANLPKRGALKD